MFFGWEHILYCISNNNRLWLPCVVFFFFFNCFNFGNLEKPNEDLMLLKEMKYLNHYIYTENYLPKAAVSRKHFLIWETSLSRSLMIQFKCTDKLLQVFVVYLSKSSYLKIVLFSPKKNLVISTLGFTL